MPAALTEDVVRTSEIEGELLRVDSVRSSLARRLGVDVGARAPADRHVEGVVDMVLHASTRTDQPLTAEMQCFLDWANADAGDVPLIKAGLAHLWFVTLHPFDDGNGRIARAVGDLFLARADGSPQRFYSLSAQIQRERAAYYDILEQTKKKGMDVTPWLLWFLDTLGRALVSAQATLDQVLAKSRFWQCWATTPMNERQIKLLNRLLDGSDGKLTSSTWAKIAKCSPDTALRDITELMSLGVLKKLRGGGRSTGYGLAVDA